MNESSCHVDAVQVALREKGYAVIRGMLNEWQVQHLLRVMDRLQATAAPMSQEILYTHCAPPEKGPGMRRIMDQWLNPHRQQAPLSTRRCADLLMPQVATLLGQPAALFQDVLMAKHERHEPFPWHQDFPFWPVDKPLGLIAWVPLDGCDAASGGLHLAERSHLGGVGPAVDLYTGQAQEGAAGVTFHAAAYAVCCPVLEPGDAVLFQPLTWHMSPPNRSGRRRRVWATTWLDQSVRWSPQRAPRHPLCHFIDEGAPVIEMLEV